MSKVKLDLTLDNIVAAVVPAIEKALQPKFDGLEERLSKKIETEFNTLAAMTNNKFVKIDEKLIRMDTKLDDVRDHLIVIDNHLSLKTKFQFSEA